MMSTHNSANGPFNAHETPVQLLNRYTPYTSRITTMIQYKYNMKLGSARYSIANRTATTIINKPVFFSFTAIPPNIFNNILGLYMLYFFCRSYAVL